ncbi:MAG: hypothetical protein IE926_09875 [Micrococcales bacterium]|nr:hypothetical protein [Micrococcales bacterium]
MSTTVDTAYGASVRVPSPAFRATFAPRTSASTSAVPTPGDPLGSVLGGVTEYAAPVERPVARLASTTATATQAALAESILDAEDALTSVHRAWFAPARRPEAPRPEWVDETTIRARHIEAALRGVPWFDLPNRRRAAKAAQRAAHTDIDVARRAAEERVQAEEARIDAWWNNLCANDPQTVTEYVNGVFAADAGSRATALGTRGAAIEVAVLAPGEHVLPAEQVRMAADRSLTIRRASASHRAELYRQHVAGLVVATARRALAASPGADSVTVHVLRSTCTGPFDDVSLLAVADIARDDLQRADFGLDAVSLLGRIGRRVRLGVAGAESAMEPLPLDVVPGLAQRLERRCSTHRASA